ncbi:MAG: CoB--CoM heterodisulfide reductase iron-sulfur subunit B family protein [Thermodesulfovibrio sp.]|uniref:CoB--CoM heterodisulfide reductase iron-sulfur subunit B family protein n=1 Tax=unclassified Thermodesulfovibrio TaxID=2645936 RepID=UPI00083B2EA9|nr:MULTISPECIES: CoB--CoM heterodisulfide reductase iron-sulfur subunit B family protein [unclassified Thermodesulfovibrio]MDI1471214.1 CoB--CoM heterodisulfide reductase iron-sulfur subunit B family protein [Thermodesulfovibrio sp. 1176]MDI6715298.1 CoB--CoM heterodisulfide reductase iron-sulfur subunit B family protein [Thermodesulfovibrio sp.]ODA44158.1 CoB--CoM heterodisulfide reductase subunit B [Thermodesulfovibrio sp. N1]
MQKIGIFLGCNIPFNRPDIEYSMRFLLKELGVEIVELEGATCCPAYGTMPSLGLLEWAVASAWNLSIAEEKGVDMLTGCGSCYGVQNEANYYLKKHPEIKEQVDKILAKVGRKYDGTVKVWNVINFIYEKIGLDTLKQKIKYNLNGLKCAVQTGCHNLWPSKAFPSGEDNTFFPKRLREICEIMGGVAPHYSTITDCCGMGALRSNAPEKSLALFKKKLDVIKEELDPDLAVIGCSSCLLQFDAGQALLIEQKKLNYKIPALHLAQLTAIALGAEVEKATAMASIPLNGVITKIKGGN